MPTLKSYTMVPQSGNAGEARLLVYRYTFTAAPFAATTDDPLQFAKFVRGTKIAGGNLQFSLNDGGAGAGRVDVRLTNGTTTYTLIKAADVSAVGHVAFGTGTGAQDWLGKVLDDVGTWRIEVLCSTNFSAAAAAGFYALAVHFVANPAPDAY